MKQWTSDDFRPPHKLLRPQVLTSPEMATPQQQLRPEGSEEQAANLQVLQGFFDACGVSIMASSDRFIMVIECEH